MRRYQLEDISLDLIRDFIENGNPDNVDEGIVEYLDMLEKIRGMKRRFDIYATKEHILKHLIKVDKLSRYLANSLYEDCVEYFYLDNKISKEAYRNMYAEDADADIALARLLAKDTSDLAKVMKMRKDAYEMRELHKDDPIVLPEEWFQKPFKLYAMDAGFLGLPEANRHTIIDQIDKYPELTEKERVMLKREAGALPIKLFLDESEDARKS